MKCELIEYGCAQSATKLRLTKRVNAFSYYYTDLATALLFLCMMLVVLCSCNDDGNNHMDSTKHSDCVSLKETVALCDTNDGKLKGIGPNLVDSRQLNHAALSISYPLSNNIVPSASFPFSVEVLPTSIDFSLSLQVIVLTLPYSFSDFNDEGLGK